MKNKNVLITAMFVFLCYSNAFVYTKVDNIVQNDLIKEEKTWVDIANESKNAVVQIFSYSKNFNWLKPCEPPVESGGTGSGFFVNENGRICIVTNYHVIKEANPIYIQIPVLGKDRFDVEIVGCHPDKDIAVLELKDKSYTDLLKLFKNVLGISNIPYLVFGSSDNLAGKVMALGYPLGQENIKSSIGYVAGTQHIMGKNLIQTIAPTNPGNSGCPFLDKNGKVVGIHEGGIPSAQNVGYFIPINDVKNIINGFISGSYKKKIIKRNFWGFSWHNTTEDTLAFLGFPTDGGVRVAKVIKNSVFDKRGGKKGDIIYAIKIGGQEIEVDRFGYVNVDWCPDKIPMTDLILRLDIGQEFIICVYRNINGEIIKHEFNFTIEGDIDFPIREKYPEFEQVDYDVLGMIVMELAQNHVEILQETIKITAKESDFLWLPGVLKYIDPEENNKSILIITHIYPGSAVAETRCFSRWDVIDKVNGIKVRTVDEFRNAVRQSFDTDVLTIESKDGDYAAIPMQTVLEKEQFVSYFNPFAKSKLLEEMYLPPAA